MAPINARSKVVLPAPLRPINPHNSPVANASTAMRINCTTASETSRPEAPSRRGDRVAGWSGSADEGLNARIGERHGRRHVGDDGAVVNGEHAVREPCHDVHVVLDEQDRQYSAPECRYDDIHQAE